MSKQFIIITSTLLLTGLIVLILLNKDQNLLMREYDVAFRDSFFDKSDNEVTPHYRIKGTKLYYYENCSDGIRLWCKNIVNDVDPRKFIPLSKDLGKVIMLDGSTRIYYKDKDITSEVVRPQSLEPLGRMTDNPQYFTDKEFIYYTSDLVKEETNTTFPLELESADLATFPSAEKITCDINKIIFINNDVYYNGEKIPNAEANSFVEIGKNWFKDDKGVFYGGYKLYEADSDTFELFSNGYTSDCSKQIHLAKDLKNLYFTSVTPNVIKCPNFEKFCLVDFKIPHVTPVNISAINTIDKYAIQNRTTLNVDGIEYYLDGTKKEKRFVDVLITTDNYLDTTNNKYVLWAFVNDETVCSSTKATYADLPYEAPIILTTNVGKPYAKAYSLEKCANRLEVDLQNGQNDILVKDNNGETVLNYQFYNDREKLRTR